MSKNRAILYICCIALSLGMSSCGSVVKKKLINGTYRLTNFSINNGETNFMDITLPDHVSNSDCCKYLIDFNDDGTVTGTYYLADTVNYTVSGTWDLPERLLLDIELDLYVNGKYDIDRKNKKDYILETDMNVTDPSYLGGVESPVKLTIERVDI